MKSIFSPSCSFSCIPSLLNSSTTTCHPQQKCRRHPGLPPSPSWVCLLAAPAPSLLPGLSLSLGPQRQPAQPTKAKAWLTLGVQEVKGGGDIPHHSAGFSLIEVLLLLDVGQDGAWRAEGAERTVFSGSSKSSTFSEAKFSKVSSGDTGLLITECPAPVWYLAQTRCQHKTGLDGTGQLSSAPVYDECRRADVGQIWLLKSKRTKSDSTWGWGPL